jgi:hypothetical protein
MPSEVPITLAVEDELSEHVVRALLAQTSRGFLVGAVYGKRGADFLRQRILAFNNAARGSAHLVLTDLDTRACVPDLVEQWFGCRIQEYPKRRHANLVFRVAVREIESWVMADRENFADFLGVRRSLIPAETDTIPDPKRFLLQLASQSRKRDLRSDIVPNPGDRRKVGPDYNGRLGEFTQTSWRASVACAHSASLAKAWKALLAFRPVYETPQKAV